MHTATKIMLPRQKAKGRQPCEYRIGDFVVPKAIKCASCNEDKATTVENFVNALNKSGLDNPQDFVNQYTCRSCRKDTQLAKVSKVVKTSDTEITVGKFTATRVALPKADNQRGRAPCEWRIGDFVIPKTLTCSVSGEIVATTRDGFMAGLVKSGLDNPQDYMNQYVSRAGRKVAEPVVEPVAETTVQSVAAINTRSRKSCGAGLQLGFVVNNKPVIFYASKSDFETNGVPVKALRTATMVYELTKPICVKHPDHELSDADKLRDMDRFANVDTVYDYMDINKVIADM